MSCVGGRTFRDLFRRAAGNDRAAAVASLGAEVDDVVGSLDDVEIMLNDKHGVATVHQRLQHFDQSVDVSGVKSRCRLVQHEYRFAGRTFGKLGSQLNALRLTAGKCGGRLSDFDTCPCRPRREHTHPAESAFQSE